MELVLFIWGASVVGKVAALFNNFAIVLLLLVALLSIYRAFDNDAFDRTNKYPIQKQWGRVSVSVATLLLVLYSILPSERTMYLMLAGYTGQKVVQSEAAEKVVKLINLKLDEYLEEAEKQIKK